MEAIYIHGGIALQGQVRIQGSKNAVLPVMAAALLTEGTSEISNCPRLTDVYRMQTILESMGCTVARDQDRLRITPGQTVSFPTLRGMPANAVKGMRSSLVLLGALLGTAGEVRMEYPGGCVIGARPIDLHRMALEKMNVTFEETAEGLYAFTGGLKGADIVLPVPSVGATENLLLAAVRAEGTTAIRGAAKEPEIVTLAAYLSACGADITGAGTETIVVQGREKLSGCDFAVPGDRIVAGTYLAACMAAGGEVLLKGAPTEQLGTVTDCAGQMGAVCQTTAEGLYVQVHERLSAPKQLVTGPYPGFPTDLQSPFLTALTVAEGECEVEETVFENRFHIVPQLRSMGARLKQTDSRHVTVQGVSALHGFTVSAKELRGGAALVIAGAAAKGETVVDGCCFIERGYENICRDLKELGVRIYSV